jgi:hypothetical protein
MFNLGTKQLCLTVTRTLQKQMGNLHRRIRNFAIPTVAAAAGRQGEFLLQKMQWQVCTIILRLHLMTILKRTTLYLVFAQKEYCLISLVILMYGLSNKAGSTNIGGAFAAAQDLTIR